MSLPLDLTLLESDKKFQQLCCRIICKELPNAIMLASGSWDGGRDILCIKSDAGDVVFQCKYTQQGLSKLKPKIKESLSALRLSHKISKWILCLSVETSGHFIDWLREEMADFPFIEKWEVWGKEELLQRLEKYPDILETFFFPVWKALESRFRTEELELISYNLESTCGWECADPQTLRFYQKTGSDSDLVIDIIVRSRGTIQSLIQSLRLEVADVRRLLRGLPGTALLFSQHTYNISLNKGRPGIRTERLDPPLTVEAGAHQRFKVKLEHTGFAWSGNVRLALLYGNDKNLVLPWMTLSA